MKYILTVLAVLVAIPALIYMGGLFISENHSSTASRIIHTQHHEVWETVTNVMDRPEWDPSVARVEILSDSGQTLRWREYYTDNDPITFEEVMRADSSRFVGRIADEQLPFGGTWTYELEQAENGVRLTITEDGEIYNPLFRFIARFIMGYSSTMENYLDNVEKKFDNQD